MLFNVNTWTPHYPVCLGCAVDMNLLVAWEEVVQNLIQSTCFHFSQNLHG
jgi:hypothetical protein